MRIAGVYLIYTAVLLRALVIFADEPRRNLVILYLAMYGLLLLAEPWINKATVGQRTANRAWIMPIYLVVQSALATGLLFIQPFEDFFALLFVPLSLQAVFYFGSRTGFLWIALFALLMTGGLLGDEQGRLFGLAMAFLYSSLCFLFGGYAHQVHQAEEARHKNQQMLGELQVAHRQLQEYAIQVEDLATEQERNRLARDLHDSVTQTVFSMNLTVQSAHLLLDKEPGRVSGQLERLEELATSAMREIQALVSQLRPRSIADEGLPAALRRLAAERQTRDGLELILDMRDETGLPEPEAVGLYRIVQEALNNVAKHAETRQATIRLDLSEKPAYLEIEDHGQGFDTQAVMSKRGHLGLTGMSERARELGWHLSIESHPGQGTRIRVEQSLPDGET